VTDRAETRTQPHIVLIGLRCSGKSTLAPRLAAELDRPCLDLDDRVARAMDADSPARAIERDGIDAFRETEARELDAALAARPSVLALGGGAPTAPGAREALEHAAASGAARVFYLRAEPDTLAARMRATDTAERPTLVGDDAVGEIRTLFDQRDPLYESLAESTVETDGVGIDAALAALVALARAGS